MNKCPNCQSQIELDSIFCSNCGTKLNSSEMPDRIIKIGRAKENDIVVNDPLVGRYHAVIKIFNNYILLEDLNSTNGTFVNGKKISSSIITEKDKITLGKSYELDIKSIFKPESKKTPIPSIDKNVITIGRSLDNDIVLNNIKVSRRHAKLERVGDNWYLEDLGSANKTYVNSKPIKKTKITSNDIITIGGVPLSLENLFKSKSKSLVM
jgi:pSer/pThr/pTyr-binding forkhead associated (FHA) protein